MTEKLGALLSSVTRGKAEVTLEELFSVFDLPSTESTLAKILKVKDQILSLGLRLSPDITSGELDTIRRLDFPEATKVSEDTIKEEIRQRESSALEFKSSLLYDHRRALHDKNATQKDLRSEEVLHSSLKTICAFLTSGGGILYVGIDDEGNSLGLEFDFSCMTTKDGGGNDDTWELMLRDLLKSKFKDGEAVNDYVNCQLAQIEGKLVARIQVASRRQLTFLMVKGGCQLFKRQGNRTEQVLIEQMEEFIESRKRNLS
ncbi:MAG: ATP-binding protein [Chthonomonadales bacterium]